ncbi:E3 ubiquitin-protein ligase synoviolin [Tyrophagus putrescentiae]|nr:E3 ubiquitin-protein ligase synoviolin [Tyrophagus putrescentiae]
MPVGVTESTFLILTSVVMSSFVIANAYLQKQQFYPSVVYITKSNASMAIIYIQGLVLVLLLGKLFRKIFFGQLRTAEMEHLIERSWYAVTETCLAFTVFRDDLSPKFVALFTLLLFLKCFHWLAEDRVDYMERSPNISLLFHIRVTSLLSILGLLDLSFVYMAYYSTLTKGASVQLVFGFEYAILFAIMLNISMKYVLHFFDLYNENPWEDKAIYLLYTELIMGFLKICLYFIFIMIMMKIHTFPLFAIRPMYLTIRGFKKALNDVIMSRRAILNMNTLYPDATTQDIENSDNVCIICRENMLGNGTCKKLPCNHIFHVTCLRSWFQRQQTCPTCRMDVLRTGSNQANQNNNNANNANNANNNANDANANNNANIANGPIRPLPPFMFQHFQQLFNNRPNNQNDQNAAGASSGQAASSSSNNNTAPPMPPLPPMNFHTVMLPFLQSPLFQAPQLPANEALLQGLSDQELRLLEGSERRNIEARLKCLMEVKTLIDSATSRLQQYHTALNNTPNSVAVATQTETTTESSVSSGPSTSSAKPNSSSLPNSSTKSDSSAPQKASTSADIESSGDRSSNDPHELIRKRRLERFTQASDNGQEASTAENSAQSEK